MPMGICVSGAGSPEVDEACSLAGDTVDPLRVGVPYLATRHSQDQPIGDTDGQVTGFREPPTETADLLATWS